MLNLNACGRAQPIQLLLLARQRMIAPRLLIEPHLDGQVHPSHPVKASVAVETGAIVFELLADWALSMVILEDFEVMSAASHPRALVHNNAGWCADHDLLESVPFLLPRVVAFALGWLFRLALGLLHSINDEGEFRIRLAELFD